MSDLGDPQFRETFRDAVELFEAAGMSFPPAQRAILRALGNAVPLTKEERKLLRGGLFGGGLARTKLPELGTFVSTFVFLAGRRLGKSYATMAQVVADMLLGDWHRFVLPGTRAKFAVIDPSLEQAREEVAAAKYWLDGLRALGVEYVERAGHGKVEIEIVKPRLPAVPVLTVYSGSVTVQGSTLAGLVIGEAGLFPTDLGNPASAREILAAAKPAMLQFHGRARVIVVGTPHAAKGLFFEWCGKPPAGALFVKAPSWATGFYTEAECRAEALDSRHFQQMYEVSRWGALDEQMIARHEVRACVDPARILRRPKEAPRVIVLDHGKKPVLCVARHELRPVGDGTEPISDVVIEHVVKMDGGGDAVLVEDVIQKILELRKAYRGVVEVHFDIFTAPEFHARLKKLGIRTVEIDVSAKQQTIEWTNLFNLIRARRIVFPDDELLVDELAGLRVTELASGAWQVKGRGTRHDVPDVLKRAAHRALTLPPSGGTVGVVYVPIKWDGHQMNGGGRRWYERLPNGQVRWLDPPLNTPEFDDAVENARHLGTWSPAMQRFREQNPDEFPDDVVPVAAAVGLPALPKLATGEPVRRPWQQPCADTEWVEGDAPPRGWVKR